MMKNNIISILMGFVYNKKCCKWRERIFVLVLLFSKVVGMCPSGYIDIGANTGFCFMIPFLRNNPNTFELDPGIGKTWDEAQKFCRENGKGNLASFKSKEDMEKLNKYLKNVHVIRRTFRDYTNVTGIYLPENSTVCPEPPIGCALWYVGLRRTYRWTDNSAPTFEVWAPKYVNKTSFDHQNTIIDHSPLAPAVLAQLQSTQSVKRATNITKIGSLSPSSNEDTCAAGPCSTSFGLCEVLCSQKLSYICMARKISQTGIPGNGETPPTVTSATVVETPPTVTSATVVSENLLSGSINRPSAASTTVVSEHVLPESMSLVGRMMVHLAEAVLPEMAIVTLSQLMNSVNTILFTVGGLNFGVSFK